MRSLGHRYRRDRIAAPIAAERQISFELTALPTVNIEADALRLRQVIDKLLSDAIKYNNESGRITVELIQSATEIELRVIDTGRGMIQGEQVNRFERFYGADSVRGSSIHDAGLGRNISGDICRRHGGDLQLESVSNQGTTARVTRHQGNRMPLDTQTLLLLDDVIVGLCGVSFILNTALNQNDSTGRVWSVAFITAMMVALAHIPVEAGQTIWWAVVVANVSLSVAVGSVWAGLRRYNGRGRTFWVIAAVSILVLVATLVHGEAAGRWAGAAELWTAVAAFVVLQAVRGRRAFGGGHFADGHRPSLARKRRRSHACAHRSRHRHPPRD